MNTPKDPAENPTLQVRTDLLNIILHTKDVDELLQDILGTLIRHLGVDVVGAVLSVDGQPQIRVISGVGSSLEAYLNRLAQEAIFSDGCRVMRLESPESPGKEPSPFAPEERSAGIQSRVIVPLFGSRSKEAIQRKPAFTPIGFLYLASQRRDAFRPYSDGELQILGEYVSVALAHVLSLSEAQERLRRLEALRSIDLTIIESHSIEAIVNVVLEQVPQQLGAEAIAVHLWEEESQELTFFAMRLPNGTVLHEQVFTLSSELLHELIELQRPVIIPNLKEDARVQVHRELIDRYHLVSYLGVPMTVGEDVMGVLHILTIKPRQFRNEDVDFFVTLAGQAAIGISHVRAYQELNERATAVEAFVQLPDTLARDDFSHPMDLIGPVMELLANALGIKFVEFYAYDAETNILSLTHTVGKIENAAVFEHYQVSLEDADHPVARAARIGHPLYIADAVREGVKHTAEYRTLFVVPVVATDKLFGVLACYQKRPHAFPQSRRQLIELFVHDTAVLLKNSTLIQELRGTNERLQRALEAREDMIRNVTHELRTPLTMIRGYAELMTMGMVSDMKEAQELAHIILRNAVHLEHLIDQLLHLQSLQQVDIHQEEIDIGLWLREVVANWRRVLEQEGFVLRVDIQAPLGRVLGHPDFLREVMDIVLDNARKFSPSKGEIRIRAWREKGEIYVSVSDQGVGIPRQELERIFDRFYQVDASTTRDYGGMGIGLALAKEIISRHGGRIWAESEGPGKGTTITFTLPVTENNEQTE